MTLSLGDIADGLVDMGISVELHGDRDMLVESVATLEVAGPRQISFLSNPKYAQHLAKTKAGAVVIGSDAHAPDHLHVLRAPDPYFAITAIIIRLHGYRRHPGSGIDELARVDETAEIGDGANVMQFATIGRNVRIGHNATIYPGCYVADDCRIGDDVVLFPNVVLYDGTILGDRVTLHAGTAVGNDGLGYAPHEGEWHKIPQIGHVEIDDDVEVGPNCVIDRASIGKTTIGPGTKFSDLIAIGHGAHIGGRCMFVAQVGIAGSTTIEDHVTMAGQAGVVGHVTIGENAIVGAQAGVINDIEPNVTVLGAPAIPIREKKRQFAAMAKLPEMRRELQKLQKEVRELRARLDDGQ